MGLKISNARSSASSEDSILHAALSLKCHMSLEHLPRNGAKHIRGKSGPKLVLTKIPCDFVGSIEGGRAIFFDAKVSGNDTGFSLHDNHVPRHQREFLAGQGRMGALSGLLIEATSPQIGRWYWMSWERLVTTSKSVSWDDSFLVDLGSRAKLVQFSTLLAWAASEGC